MTRVKICGLTSFDDALFALESGADMLGFILYPRSPRYIKAEAVQAILNRLGDRRTRLTCVGVFVNEPVQSILSILDQTKLDLAQLSGDEPVDTMKMLDVRAYKAVRQLQQAREFLAVRSQHSTNDSIPDLLLDAHHPVLYGGSGKQADHSLASIIARDCCLLLAGGLTPDNVADAVRNIRPWGVDVASGVEAAPGVKDHAKITRFMAEVRRVDRELQNGNSQGSKVR
ncbi:MAG TPA: phosphoribosylanthranilate isomerase [Anaerolineae bacterium]|jgi:phosphoribosylanthranilate isomerase